MYWGGRIFSVALRGPPPDVSSFALVIAGYGTSSFPPPYSLLGAATVDVVQGG